MASSQHNAEIKTWQQQAYAQKNNEANIFNTCKSSLEVYWRDKASNRNIRMIDIMTSTNAELMEGKNYIINLMDAKMALVKPHIIS